MRAAYGGGETGPSPVDRAQAGSKLHIITDAIGILLAGSVTAVNVNDVTEFAPLFNKIPPVAGKVGHPRNQSDAMQGGLAYDSEPHRQGLRDRGMLLTLALLKICASAFFAGFRKTVLRISWPGDVPGGLRNPSICDQGCAESR